MLNKGRQLVDRHIPKIGIGWLINDQEGSVRSFTNANSTAHAQLVIVETRKYSRRVLGTSAFGGGFLFSIYLSLLAIPKNTAIHVKAINR